MNSHCYTKQHVRSNSVMCADCGKKFSGFYSILFYYSISTVLFCVRALKSHCYTEKHARSNSVMCADCGKKFSGFGSSGGMHYHR